MAAILFSSADRKVVVLDIPASIGHPPHLQLRSTTPLETPYTLPEPKDPTTSNLNASITETHERLIPVLTSALSLACSTLDYFTQPRNTTPTPPTELDFHTNTQYLTPVACPPFLLTQPSTTLSDLSDIYSSITTNPSQKWRTLTLRHPAPEKHFHIPPRSSFLLAPVDDPTVRAIFIAGFELRRLDFMLLDPPWPNRSAQRKKGGYKTADRFAIVPMLKRIPVRETVREGGLVAVWMTNRGGLRERFCEEVVRAWGCVVEAEWVWGKVTAQGEWCFNVESRVRKPYEILMILRREGGAGARLVEEKVLFAVPDLHSRKPAIKGLRSLLNTRWVAGGDY